MAGAVLSRKMFYLVHFPSTNVIRVFRYTSGELNYELKDVDCLPSSIVF